MLAILAGGGEGGETWETVQFRGPYFYNTIKFFSQLNLLP